jgi:hypothetical protein
MKITITPIPKSKLKHIKKHDHLYSVLLDYDSSIDCGKARFAADIYNETCSAINTKNLILACSGIRTLLDILNRIKTNKHHAEHGFTKNLDDVEKNLHITAEQKKILKNVLDIGGSAVHRDAIPKVKDIVLCIQVLENLIESLFIYPVRGKQLAAAAKKLPSIGKTTP